MMGNRFTELNSEQTSNKYDSQGTLLRPQIPKSVWTALRYTFASILLVVCFYYVGQNLAAGAIEVWLSNVSINYALLGLSILMALVCTISGGWVWSLLLAGLGAPLSTRSALKVHLLSLLPKYLPGFAWQQIGKTYLCTQAGVPKAATIVGVSGELVMAVLAGLAVLLLTLPSVVLPIESNISQLLPGFVLPGVAVLYSLAVPLALRTLLRSKLAQCILGAQVDISYTGLLCVFGAMMCSWLLLGMVLFLVIGAFYLVPFSLAPRLIFTSTLSFLGGLLVVFAPMGLGVREGILTLFLSMWLPAPIAAAAAISARLIIMIGEVMGFLIALKL